MARKAYSTDVRDDAWAFMAPYLTLMTAEAPQRDYRLREVFKASAGSYEQELPGDHA